MRTEVRLGPGDTVLDGDPALPRGKGNNTPTFRATSIEAKRSPISATPEVLFACLLFAPRRRTAARMNEIRRKRLSTKTLKLDISKQAVKVI